MVQAVSPGAPMEKADSLAMKWDLKGALSILQPLAAQGDAVAQFKIGHLYDVDGAMFQIKNKGGQLGTPETDFENAKNWYQKSADQGYARAEGFLGKLYIWGIGAMRDQGVDNERGVELLLKAAAQGDREAQCSLGLNYQQGIGVAINPDESLKWFRLAAEQEDEYAASQIGYMYSSGNGLPKDPIEAYVWLTIAGEEKTSPAKNMTMEQVEEGDRRIEAIRARNRK